MAGTERGIRGFKSRKLNINLLKRERSFESGEIPS